MPFVNYDEIRNEEDRDFVIRGETFTIKRCPPEVLDEFVEMEKRFEAEHEDAPDYRAAFDFAEERLLILIDDQNGAHARWKELRQRKEDPVTYWEVIDVSRQAVSKITGFPTMPPSSSAPSPGSTKATSKAG